MNRSLTRRDFLKIGALALSTIAWRSRRAKLPPEDQQLPMGIGRVTNAGIHIYQEPSYKSTRLGWRSRDSLLPLVEEITSPHGPSCNPRWYRTIGGFVHSAYLQRVESAYLNEPLARIPEGGQLGEVTVPFTQTLRYTKNTGWYPLYRLYFGSVHWITHLEEGLDGKPWYGLTNERLRVIYFVPASHLRPIPARELFPISADVPPDDKLIQISVARQRLTAYEGNKVVFQAPVSTGVHSYGVPINGIPTDTPIGNFSVSLKTPSRHMGEGDLTSDPNAYELIGVPWVNIFHAYGVGLHGTFWHDNFGTPMSHGCVNLRNEDAKWVYRWTTPTATPKDWFKQGRGTVVQVV